MKKLIIGLVIGFMMGLSTIAAAAEGDQVQAIFAKFNLIINGQPTEMETVPLVYNGTSYLPVRELSNLVGYDVTYKADSRTIELSNVTGATYDQQPAAEPPAAVNTEGDEEAMTVTPTTINESDINLDEWVPLQDLSQNYGVKTNISKSTTVSYGSAIIEFPYSIKSQSGSSNKEAVYYTSTSGNERLMIWNAIMYISKNSLDVFDLNQ